MLGTVTGAYLGGRSLGKEQGSASLGHRLAEALRDPLAMFLARSPGTRGAVVRLTKVEPHDRASAVTHVRHPDSGFFPAGYYGLGDDALITEPDTINVGQQTDGAGGGDGFGPPVSTPGPPGDILIPPSGGGGSGGGGGGGGPGGGGGGGPGGGGGGGPGGGGGGGPIVPPSAVPEPATWIIMIVGFLGVGMAARRQATAHA